MELSVKSCDGRKIQFLLKRTKPVGSTKELADRLFNFDFRYYEPYHGVANLVSSGLYVFKTEDKNSRSYGHYITKI